MYFYIELWKARSAWLELSDERRKSWLDRLLAALREQLEGGVEPVGLVANDADTPRSAGYDFFAVWRMSDAEVARRFEDFIERVGWHDYFEQVNARGQALEMDSFVSSHLNLGRI